MLGLDAATTGQIFRKDFPIVLACDRHQAYLAPIRIGYDGAYLTSFPAGLVMGRKTSDGFYRAYDDGHSDGTQTAVCVLFASVDAPVSGNSTMGVGIFQGKVYEDKLTGIDSAGKTDLKSRSITDAGGDNILIF